MSNSHDTRNYDTLILGAGPAGLALAAAIARRGFRALVIDRDDVPRSADATSPVHLQSVFPAVRRPLEKLDLWSTLTPSLEFGLAASVRLSTCHGNLLAQAPMGDATVGTSSAQRWISRSSLVAGLAQLAVQSGATILSSTMVLDLQTSSPSVSSSSTAGATIGASGTRVSGVFAATGNSEPRWISAPLVIDASGQQSIIASHLRLLDSVSSCAQSALVGLYENVSLECSARGARTLYFPAHQRSRLWLAPLAGGLASVGIVGPRGTLLRDRHSFAELLEDELVETPALAQCLLTARLVAPLAVIRSTSHKLLRGAGDGWVAVGDTLETLDPLPGWGIVTALDSAAHALPSIVQALEQQSSPELLLRWQSDYQAELAPRKLLILALNSPGFCPAEFLRLYPEHTLAFSQLLLAGELPTDSSFEEDLSAQLLQLRSTAR